MISFAFFTYTSFNINTTAQFFNGLPRLYTTDFNTKSTATQNSFQHFSLPSLNLNSQYQFMTKRFFHPTFLLKASDVLLHGYPNFQLMSDFFRFRKSYQWIQLLNRNLPYNLSTAIFIRYEKLFNYILLYEFVRKKLLNIAFRIRHLNILFLLMYN